MNRNTKLKQDDMDTVRQIFFDGGCHTRMKLCTACGISSGGMANILKELLKTGQIVYEEDVPSRSGRHAKGYRINPDYAHIGMLACVRKKDAFFFEAESRNLLGQTVFHKTLSSRDGCREDLAQAVSTLREADPVIGIIAISVPGVCINGRIGVCDFPKLGNSDLHDLKELKGIAWVNENDANAMCIGLVHVYPSADTAAFVFQPAAELIGCGIVIHGRLYNGVGHQAGEMRYLPWGTLAQKKERSLKEPERVLLESIGALAAVLDPDLIAWSSELIGHELHPKRDGIALPDHLRIMHIDDKNRLLKTGLYEIGKDILKNRRTGEER